MAENTVQAVRQAELQAAQLLKDTESKKMELLERTQREINEKRESNRLQEKQKTENAMIAAQSENDALMKRSIETAEQEIITLRNETEIRKKDAIKMMIAELI